MTEILRRGHLEPEVSICVPTFDAQQPHLHRFVELVERYTSHVAHEIVIADCQHALCGYTIPQNDAMSAGVGQFLLAMNDDVQVTQGWIDPLLEQARAGVWCVTPDCTAIDGPQVFAPYCMMWNRDAWREIGGLDWQFVLWASDIDIARRLVDAGHPPVRVELPNPIHHASGVDASPEGWRSFVPPHDLSTFLAKLCRQDLQRFQMKWGISAEAEKHRLVRLTQ